MVSLLVEQCQNAMIIYEITRYNTVNSCLQSTVNPRRETRDANDLKSIKKISSKSQMEVSCAKLQRLKIQYCNINIALRIAQLKTFRVRPKVVLELAIGGTSPL